MLSACCCQLLCIVLQGLLTKATLRPSNRQKRDQQQKHHAHSHSHGHSQSCVAATPTTTCTLPSRCASGNPLNGVANSECPKRLPHNALVQISANLNRLNYIKMIFKRNPNPNWTCSMPQKAEHICIMYIYIISRPSQFKQYEKRCQFVLKKWFIHEFLSTKLN